MTTQPTLRGSRVTLRPPRLDDLEDRWRWFADPAVTRYLPLAGRVSLPKPEVERYLRSVIDGTAGVLDFSVEDETGRSIGACSLRDFDGADRAELSIYLGETRAWGKGYGEEAMRLLLGHAFRDLNLHVIWLVVREGFNSQNSPPVAGIRQRMSKRFLELRRTTAGHHAA